MALVLGLLHLGAFRLIHALRLALGRRLAQVLMGCCQDRRSGGAKKLIFDAPERPATIIAHDLTEGKSALATFVALTFWLFAID